LAAGFGRNTLPKPTGAATSIGSYFGFKFEVVFFSVIGTLFSSLIGAVFFC
jgi:hypothetical protein